RRMSHVLLRGETREGDLSDELGLDPDPFAAALLLRQLAEGGCRAAQRLQLLPQIARGLGGVASAGAAGIAQLAVLVVAEHERADRTLEMRRILVAEDHEFLVLPALRLDPGITAPGAI